MKGYYLRFSYYEQVTPFKKETGSFEVLYLPVLLTTVSASWIQGTTNIFYREDFNKRIGRHPYNKNKDIAYKFEEKYYMLFPLIRNSRDETRKRRAIRWIREQVGKKITPYWRTKFEIPLINSIEDLKTLVKRDDTMKNIIYQDQVEIEISRFLEIVAAI